jgi:peptidoglycan LD-endopeptidase CwlK
MYKFSSTSEHRLASCHPDLQRLLRRAIKYMDFAVIEGHRNKEDQNKYFAEGKSKLKWPNSKHNTFLSEAVDICPWVPGRGLMWNSPQMFCLLAGVMKVSAEIEGVKIRWGGDWNGNNVPVQEDPSESFSDYPHFELVR